MPQPMDLLAGFDTDFFEHKNSSWHSVEHRLC